MTTLSGLFFDIVGLDQVGTNIDPQFGVLDYTSSVGANGELRLAYTGQFNADFSDDAFIQIDFSGFDLGGARAMPVTVTLANGATLARLRHRLTENGPQSVVFHFSDFQDIDAIDLASVDAMLFEFDPGAGGDFRIGEIGSVVPEPTSLLLLLIGSGVVARRQRRR